MNDSKDLINDEIKNDAKDEIESEFNRIEIKNEKVKNDEIKKDEIRKDEIKKDDLKGDSPVRDTIYNIIDQIVNNNKLDHENYENSHLLKDNCKLLPNDNCTTLNSTNGSENENLKINLDNKLDKIEF